MGRLFQKGKTMSKCVIFCAAGFDKLVEPLKAQDLIIAADGGLRHVNALGRVPDAMIGDFDSLGYIPDKGVVYPVEKDDTDSMLAVRLGLEKGFNEFIIYGGMDGKRLDHTIANFQMLKYLAEHGATGTLVGADYLACVIRNQKMTFPKGKEGDFSLFCLGADAEGVSIRGLYYEVENISMTSGFPLGVSNHFTEKPVEIAVQSGCLLALWERKAGLPEKITPVAAD